MIETTKTLPIFAVLLITASLVGCPSGDPDSGSSDTDEPPPPELPGVRVNCCYFLEAGSDAVGCTTNNTSPCVDPADPMLDLDGSGDLNDAELANLCGMKCPSNPNDYPFNGAQYYDGDNPPFDYPGEAPYNACVVTDGSRVSPNAASCDPTFPGQLDEWSGSVAPTHEGSFAASTSGNSADVTVNGVTVAVDYDGQYSFSVSDCRKVRTQKVCYLELQTLDLALVGSPVFGGYEVDGATLDLAVPQTTTATFNCTASECFGTFDFSDRTGTAISMNLSWDQTTRATGSIGGGSMLLSNAREGLGGVNRLFGELELDASMASGTLRLHGAGSDAFGGDFASATFDVTGPVTRYTH